MILDKRILIWIEQKAFSFGVKLRFLDLKKIMHAFQAYSLVKEKRYHFEMGSKIKGFLDGSNGTMA